MTGPLSLNPGRVHIVRTIPAPRQAVFEAWLDPARLAKFLKPAPGMVVTVEKLEPRVGGVFAFLFTAGETKHPIRGEYKAIDRFDRLVFSWLDSLTLPTSVVTLTFEETGPRRTKLTLEHTGFPDQAACTSHVEGWGEILQLLERTLAA